MIASSTSIDDDIKGNLIQLEKKIAQFIKVMSQLVTHSIQAPATSIAMLFPMSKNQNLSSSKKGKGWKPTLSKAKRFNS